MYQRGKEEALIKSLIFVLLLFSVVIGSTSLKTVYSSVGVWSGIGLFIALVVSCSILFLWALIEAGHEKVDASEIPSEDVVRVRTAVEKIWAYKGGTFPDIFYFKGRGFYINSIMNESVLYCGTRSLTELSDDDLEFWLCHEYQHTLCPLHILHLVQSACRWLLVYSFLSLPVHFWSNKELVSKAILWAILSLLLSALASAVLEFLMDFMAAKQLKKTGKQVECALYDLTAFNRLSLSERLYRTVRESLMMPLREHPPVEVRAFLHRRFT